MSTAPVAIPAVATGIAPLSYQWFKDGVARPGATGATLEIPAVSSADLGTYTIVVTDPSSGVTSAETDLSVGSAGRLANLSVRSQAGVGSETLIVGFGILGSGSKPMMIRATGPTLTSFGVGGVLNDPKLELHQGGSIIGSNDSWSAASNAAAIVALGGDKLAGIPLGPKDAMLLQPLGSGAYSAHVTGADGATGVALIEAYDMDATAPSAAEFAGQPKLINLSARTRVGTGDDVLIAGFVLNGTLPKRLMIRGTGPSLQKFGVSGTLADPELRLFRETTLLMENQSWAASDRLEEIYAANGHKLGDVLLDPREAVLIATLVPGSYSVHVRGANETTGVGLVEVYELP